MNSLIKAILQWNKPARLSFLGKPVSETARSWARIRDKNNFSPHEHSSGKEVSVEFP